MCFFNTPSPPKAPDPPAQTSQPAEVAKVPGEKDSPELDAAKRVSGNRSGYGALIIPAPSASAPPANAVNLPR